MTDEAKQVTSEAASAESINAAANAQEAAEKARAAQIREIMAESDERMARIMTAALKETFGADDTGKYAAVVRIPLICKDITSMKDDISTINDNIKWVVRLVLGSLILALIALLVKAGGAHVV